MESTPPGGFLPCAKIFGTRELKFLPLILTYGSLFVVALLIHHLLYYHGNTLILKIGRAKFLKNDRKPFIFNQIHFVLQN